MHQILTLLGAIILFSWELLASQKLLPIFGGSYQVWMVAVFFYTLTLFLGYLLASKVAPFFKTYRWVHFGLLILGCFNLFLYSPSSEGIGMGDLFFHLIKLAFLPIFLLSMTTPLIQMILESDSETSSHFDIYSWSNAGSFLALILIPTIFLPLVPNHLVELSLKLLFLVYSLLMIALCLKSSIKIAPSQSNKSQSPILIWMALAGFGTFQYLSVTNYVAQGIGSLPFIWAIPLMIYLASFIFVFAGKSISVKSLNILLILWVGLFGTNLMFIQNTLFESFNYYYYLSLASYLINRKLFELRPQSSGEVGKYYVFINLGGVIGTFLVSVIVPLLPWQPAGAIIEMDLSLFGLFLFFFLRDHTKGQKNKKALVTLVTISIILIAYRLNDSKELVYSKRSFYGIHKVFLEKNKKVFLNGRTVHGGEFQDKRLGNPLHYYHPQSPLGEYFQTLPKTNPEVALVGLGVGSSLYYSKPDEHWDLFDIDPYVFDLAKKEFTFLKSSKAHQREILGDARKTLDQVKKQYDLIIFDAFGSVTIPFHLLTLEAFKIYLSKLNDKGVILFHISNNTFDLPRQIVAQSQSLSLFHAAKEKSLTDELGKTTSRWIAISRDFNALDKLIKEAKWLQLKSDQPIWSDNQLNFWPSFFSAL